MRIIQKHNFKSQTIHEWVRTNFELRNKILHIDMVKAFGSELVKSPKL